MPTLESIVQYLGPIREYLARDGGDVEAVCLSSDGKRLYIRLLGSCKICDLNATTIRLGILEPLRRHFPTLESIEVIPDEK